MSMEVSYQPTLRDVLLGAREAEGNAWKTSSRIVAALMALGGVWLAYWHSLGWAALFFAIAIGEWFNLLPLWPVAAYFEFKRNPKYRQQYSLGLSDEGIHFRTEAIDSKLKWSVYNGFKETNEAFILFQVTGLPSVIPKRALTTPEETAAIKALLERALARG